MRKTNSTKSDNILYEKIKKQRNHYALLARILDYPGGDICSEIEKCVAAIVKEYPNAGKHLLKFSHYANNTDLISLREHYTSTFDINPTCTLDIGFHVFGESFKRGSFLVGMNKMLRDNNIDAKGELSDHLPAVLELLSCMPDDEDYEYLIKLIIVPGLVKMKKSFGEIKSIYKEVIDAVEIILRKDHNILEVKFSEITDVNCDFLGCALQDKDMSQKVTSQNPEEFNSETSNRGNSNE